MVKLRGERNGNYLDGVPCNTRILDHQSSTDFAGGVAVFDGRMDGVDDEEEKEMMGNCFEVRIITKLSHT